jgi:hypothetical protein
MAASSRGANYRSRRKQIPGSARAPACSGPRLAARIFAVGRCQDNRPDLDVCFAAFQSDLCMI